MKKTGFNQADKTLLLAGLIFVTAFFLQLKYRGNLFFTGLLFCAEAALVGGIADWFAVTALFEKPLGFPYHTAILPRRREEFIAACIKMIQREFFGKKQLIAMVKKKVWREKLLARLTASDATDKIRKLLWEELRAYLIAKDWSICKQLAKERFLEYIRQYEPDQLRAILMGYLQQDERGWKILARLADKLRPVVESEETAIKFEKILADLQAERLRNPLMAFFASMAVSADMLNLKEAAKLIQLRLLEILTEIGEPESVLQSQALKAVSESLTEMTTSAEFQASFCNLREKLLTDCGIEKSINRAVDAFLNDINSDTEVSELQRIFDRILADELTKLVGKLQTDEILREEAEKLLYDITARSALQAQTTIGIVVRNVLAQMTEKKLNMIIRDKVEPDLIWIRINGSVVGAVIGLALFTILTVIRIVM